MTTFAEYVQTPGVNWSSLKAMSLSPLHYRYGLTHPRPDTPAMQKGRAVHVAVLEPDEFPKRYTVWDGTKRGNAFSDFALTAFEAGLEVLSAAEYDECLAIRDAVRNHPVAGPLLARGRSEVTMTWRDEATGLPCKARLDWIDGGDLTDLKTTRSIREWDFARTIATLKYNAQLAHYSNGMAANGIAPGAVRIIAVESDPPHDVAVYRLSDDALWAGAEEVAELLARVESCTKSGDWPGGYPTEQVIDLPPWAYPNDDTLGLEGLAPAKGA